MTSVDSVVDSSPVGSVSSVVVGSVVGKTGAKKILTLTMISGMTAIQAANLKIICILLRNFPT